MINLLTDHVFAVILDGGNEKRASLPELLTALATEDVFAIKGVRSHQEHAVFMFLVQLAAMALDKQGIRDPDFRGISTTQWTDYLLSISRDTDWDLISGNPGQSAFMQPGMDADEFAQMAAEKLKKNEVNNSPDSMADLFHTSKLHVTKVSKARTYEASDWIFALIERQTLMGYGGRGHHGIARMNGGYGCRLFAAVYPEHSILSDRWRRDVVRLLGFLDNFYADYPIFDRAKGTKFLLWSDHWDGESKLQISQLHPFFIEVCRRVRLFEIDGCICSIEGTSAGKRVDVPDLIGNTLGDPWAPVQKVEAEGKPVQYQLVTPKAIDAQFLRNLILGESGFEPSPMQHFEVLDNNLDMVLKVHALLGGQGKTEGFHSISIPIPSRIASILSSPNKDKESLSELAQKMLDVYSEHLGLLNTSVNRFVHEVLGNTNKSNTASYMRARCRSSLTLVGDQSFIPALWEAFDTGDITSWQEKLKLACERSLKESMAAVLTGSAKHLKAEVLALAEFSRRWEKLFGEER